MRTRVQSGEKEFIRLIPLIYDAAEDPVLWPETVAQIGRCLNAAAQVFTIDDLRHGKSDMTAAIGIDPAFHRLYNERYESLNLHLQRARPLLVPGRVLASHQLCTDQETLATEYYQDFLRLQDGWFHLLGGCVAKDRSMLSVLSFMRGRRAGPFADREIKVLESLMPHLRRAVRLHQVFTRNRSLTACLDDFPVGAVLVGEHGSVDFANRAALAMLKTGDGIGIDRNGCLTSTAKNLRQMIAAACATAAGNGLADAGACLIARASGKSPYTVSVSPFRNANLCATVRCPGAVVFIADPETRRGSVAQVLRRLYGLTAAEAGLAGLLVEGKNLTEACEHLGVRRSTARTHLQHLSAKLGVRRQAELVSTILRTVGMLAVDVENR